MITEPVEPNNIARHLSIDEALRVYFQTAQLTEAETKFFLTSKDFKELLDKVVTQEYVGVEELKKSAWWVRGEVTDMAVRHCAILAVYSNMLGYKEWRHLISHMFVGKVRNLRFQPPALDFIRQLRTAAGDVTVTVKRSRSYTAP